MIAQYAPNNGGYTWDKPTVLNIGDNEVLRIRGLSSSGNAILEEYFWIYPEGTFYMMFAYPKNDQAKLELTIKQITYSFQFPDKR